MFRKGIDSKLIIIFISYFRDAELMREKQRKKEEEMAAKQTVHS